jgi:hypothetical protein
MRTPSRLPPLRFNSSRLQLGSKRLWPRPLCLIVAIGSVVFSAAPGSTQTRDELPPARPRNNERDNRGPDGSPESSPERRYRPEAPQQKRSDKATPETGTPAKPSPAKPANPKQADNVPLEHKGPGGIVERPIKPPAKRALGAVIPDAPIERAKLLRDLYAHLATAVDEQAAAPFVEAIERIWLTPGSDTVLALMERAMQAASQERPDLALNLLDAVTKMAPDYAEGFNRRAYVFYNLGDRERALGDLRRVLALDPNHFKAIDGLAQIMKDFGDKKAAYAAYQKLILIHPFWPSAQSAHDELKKDVEGQGL